MLQRAERRLGIVPLRRVGRSPREARWRQARLDRIARFAIEHISRWPLRTGRSLNCVACSR
jgi:hypothetical protein